MTKNRSDKKLVNAMRKHGISAIGKATKLLLNAHRSRLPAATGNVVLHSEEEAYRVQDAVFAALWPGVRAAAWKVGGPSDKVEPTAAPIPPAGLLHSPASVAGAKIQLLGVEAEVAFRLARDLPPRTRPYPERAVAAAVGEVVVTIEVCGTRLSNWKKTAGLWKLADFQNNSALVVGSGTKDWQKIDFRQQAVEFRIGARLVKVKGAHSFGNPFRLLPWLVRHCARGGFGLHAGDIVTTGAWTGLEIAKAGDEVTARFPGIGQASVRIL